jgi:hypothetical protein
MDLGRPYKSMIPTLDGEVLTVLAGTTHPLTGREVARLANHGSQKGIQIALNRLVEQGSVHAQHAGSSLLYTLNRDHLVTPAVEVIAGIRGELLRRLRTTIESWILPPVHASLFGSAARGDGDTTSDIDLLIVRSDKVDSEDPVWQDQIDDLAHKVLSWTGNRAGIAEVPRQAIDKLLAKERPLVKELRSDAINLFGITITTLLERKK